MMSDQEFFEACGLPEELCGLWAAEYHPGPDGQEGVFHVETLATILQTSEAQHISEVLLDVMRDIDDRMERREQRDHRAHVLTATAGFMAKQTKRGCKGKCHRQAVRS